MLVERRIISEDADGIVVDFQSIGDRLDNDAIAASVGNYPVELGDRELVIKINIAEVDFFKESFGFGDSCALTKYIGKELELGDIVFAIDVVIINGITDEIEASDAETFFIDGII